MNLEEIINRPDDQQIAVQEAAFVIEQYIKERKGVDIKCTPDFANPFEQINLLKAYNTAREYYKNKSKDEPAGEQA